MQPSADVLSKLLLTLYAAPLQPPMWQTFLRELTEMLGLPAAAILYHDLERQQCGFSSAVGLDPAALSVYERHYGQLDPWRPKFLAKREGELVCGDELCSPRELAASEFYHDYLRHHDVTLDCCIATVKRPTHFEVITVYRGLDAAPPDATTRAMIDLLIPHIRHALKLRQQIAEAEVVSSSYTQVLDSLSAAVFLMNERAECVYVSGRAEALCTAGDGLYLLNSRLGAHRADEHAMLRGMIERAIALALGKSTVPCGTTVISREYAPPLKASAFALPGQIPASMLPAEKRALVAVLVRGANGDVATLPAILIMTYGLTRAEARLSTQLFEGCSLAQAAERNRVSRETVRGQLRSIFGKTQVRRQADLMRLMAQLQQSL